MTTLPFPFQPPPSGDELTRDSALAAWRLAETALAAAELDARLDALNALIAQENTRCTAVTSLVLYHLMTVDDAPGDLRLRALDGLALAFLREDGEWLTPAYCRQFVAELLRHIDTPALQALLASCDGSHGASLLVVLDRVAGVTDHLVAIAADRDGALRVSLLALRFVRELGLVTAQAPLEALELRLLGRHDDLGVFSGPKAAEDQALLAAVQETITYLREDH